MSLKLGPCCICERYAGVRNLMMLPRRAPIAGHGWGCFECDLELDGAMAVLCDACLKIYRQDREALKFVCRGYPATEGRMPIGELSPEPFDHDPNKHQEMN